MRKIYLLLLSLILLPYGMRAQNDGDSTNEEENQTKVTVSFSQNEQTVTSVPYGSTVTITAKVTSGSEEVDGGTVTFYPGEVTGDNKVNSDPVNVTSGSATLSVTIDSTSGFAVGTYTITAVYTPAEDSNLLESSNSAELTVTKAEQTAPTGTFLPTSSTENSITVTFTDVTQPENENGIEIAYAVEPAASEPTSNWTTAEKINTSTSYNATIDELSPGTPYIFFARYKGDDAHEPSPAIASSSAFYTKPKITTQGLPNAYVGVECCELDDHQRHPACRTDIEQRRHHHRHPHNSHHAGGKLHRECHHRRGR